MIDESSTSSPLVALLYSSADRSHARRPGTSSSAAAAALIPPSRQASNPSPVSRRRDAAVEGLVRLSCRRRETTAGDRRGGGGGRRARPGRRRLRSRPVRPRLWPLRPEANMASLPLATAEVCDASLHMITSGELRALQPIFRIYGGRRLFAGPVVTVKVFEDNVLVRALLEEKGQGRVLVVDGGGSLRRALLGGNIAMLAQNNGWAGIVISGCVRDVDEINECDIGVRALGSHPMKSDKRGVGEKHVPVTIAGARICDGEWLYADADGILVSTTELSV